MRSPFNNGRQVRSVMRIHQVRVVQDRIRTFMIDVVLESQLYAVGSLKGMYLMIVVRKGLDDPRRKAIHQKRNAENGQEHACRAFSYPGIVFHDSSLL